MSMWDAEAGYDRDDPKHPDWHGVTSGLWDSRDKTFRCVDPEGDWVADQDDEVEAHRTNRRQP